MKYIKLFGNHSGYTEYMENNEVTHPNVSHCIQENEVHYDNNMVLPGNEEVWELYSSLVCDSARLDEDLRNIFSKYPVTVKDKTVTERDSSREVIYQDVGKLFTFSANDVLCMCFIKIFRANVRAPQYALDSIENNCGQNVLPGGVGQWEVVGQAAPLN